MKHKKCLFLTAVLMVLFVPLVARVNAASTITVNSTADNQANDGACTLREAIVASNTDTASGVAVGECTAGSGAGDLIEFDISGVGLKTIHITSGLPSISRTVTIDGYTQTGASVNTADFPNPMNGTLTVEIDAAGESGIYGIDINGSQADGTIIKGLIVNDIPYETFYLTDVDNVSLEGNYIGTSSTGNVADGGGSHGVRIGGDSTGNMIGGATAAKRNVISGNGNTGVLFYGSALTTGNYVQGNFIGVGADGTTRIGNSQSGVASSEGPTGNTIGGDGVGEGNVISGNGWLGVYLSGTGGANTVQGNHIGTNAAGSAGVYNGQGGIAVSNADSNTIGGSTVGARNVISGNSAHGISIIDDSDNNDIFGNYIGVNAAGDADLGNAVYGIHLDDSSGSNEIGSATSGTGNVISGNDDAGIAGGGDNITVKGNYIGTSADGTVAIGNSTDGVSLGGDGWIIGGTTSDDKNVISGNGGSGIRLNSASTATIEGNYIGTNAAGTANLGNTDFGVSLFGTSDSNVIGGTTSASRNVISGNGQHGVFLFNGGSTGNTVSSNYIGVGADGTTDIGNTGAGVLAGGSSNANIIGGDSAGEANLIRFNDDNGVVVSGTNNAIIGNSLYQNVTPNIDLGDDGITANDANDADSGANDLLNYPEWSTYTESAGNTSVEYTLDVPAGDYRIETFSDNGKTLIDTQNITHTGSGSESFSNTITGDGYSAVRMTVTEIDGGLTSGFGSTSEYSEAYSDGSETITVNSIADDTDDDGECTLREAITSANDNTESGISDGECIAGAAEDTIEFDITGPNYTIQPTTALPTIAAENTTINGYSQTGAVENSGDYSACFVGTILVEIDGQNAGATSGLVVSANNVTIRGLAINRFEQSGVNIGAVDGAVVAGNILGLDDAGLVDRGNGDAGVEISSTGDTLIGGTAAADRNLISGNEGYGGISSYADTGTVTISGNCIGTDATGDTAVPNNHSGVNLFQNVANVIIGGDTTQERNVISGNDVNGVALDESTVGEILGNYIGVDVDGEADLGNGISGVFVDADSSLAYVGGTASGERNVISGNNGGGINLVDGTADTIIRGNYIGVDASGSVDLGNTTDGIYAGSTNIVIGGTATGSRNVISGNDDNGIELSASATGATIQGNYVGVDASGAVDLGNTNDGIYAGSTNIVIGGSTSGSRNVISGNDDNGIELSASATDALIKGNYVGLDAAGTGGIGNTSLGISTAGINAVVGGIDNGAENIVSDNGTGGISVDGDDSTVIGNLVGTSADGLDVIGNTSVGIKSGGDDVIIGGDSSAERNVVAGTIVGGNYAGSGIVLLSFGSGNSGGIVQGNYIGTNINGVVGGGFGNGGFGIIAIGDYSNGLIGGTGSGEGNKIVSSGANGIGANGFSGFGLYTNDITILGNQVYESTSTGIRLMTDTNGDFVPDTPVPFPNDVGDADTGANGYLNFPVLNSSSASAGSLDVNFDLDIPDVNAGVTGYRVEFFANDTGDASGNGEGQIYLGSADVAGDVSNNSETITLDPGVITTGDYDISATVTEIDGSTDGFGSTSEFSAFLNDQSIIQPLDNDDDGVNDAVENAGPNGGDGNDDGTLDSEQSSVATILDNTGDNYLTLALDPDGTCNAIDDFSASTEAEQAKQEEGYDYPMGLNSFTIPCADSVDGTIYYHGHTDLSDYTHRKFGPTVPGDISSNGWYDSGFTSGTATVNGATVVTTSFSLTDGSLGDDTGADDIIVDDNGFGIEVSDSVVDSISEAASDVISGFLAKTGSGVVPAVSGAIFIILLSSRSIYIARKRSISHHK